MSTVAPSAALPNLKAVLFDLDSTLADSEPLMSLLLLEIVRDHGHAVDAEALIPLAGQTFPRKMQALGIPGPHDALDEEYRSRYRDRLGETPALDGAATLLATLSEREIGCAIVSNKVEDGAARLIAAFGWDQYLRVIVGRDTASDGTRKPDAGPALHALARLDVAPADACFVGDSADDMGCGASSGCGAVIGLTTTHPADELREAGATHICATLAEVGELLLGTRSPA
ncbi:MAG TPA: HAD family hydrolase [Dehalococcoidia bacterium]|nr:HAD family hydrolase [Dehalococcoidia bacterium]